MELRVRERQGARRRERWAAAPSLEFVGSRLEKTSEEETKESGRQIPNGQRNRSRERERKGETSARAAGADRC